MNTTQLRELFDIKRIRLPDTPKCILFAGQSDYPCGGICDLIGFSRDISHCEGILTSAVKSSKMDSIDWWQVVLIRDFSLVDSSRGKSPHRMGY